MDLVRDKQDMVAFYLRTGLGLLFIIGGLSKLSLLLGSSTHDGMVASYMGTSGYINSLFQDYLFTGWVGELLSPSLFLTSLSAFEFFSGIALVAGFLVRPLALIYGFLLWTFVIALPTMTVPGVTIDVKTYTSPSIFVQIRDIALSGVMFVLFNLGAGKYSLDYRMGQAHRNVDWNNLGLLLRFSVGMIFIVAGFFGAFSKVPNFATAQPILAIIGLGLIFGNEKIVKISGIAVMCVMLWYILFKLNVDKGIIANLNGVKREFAIFSAGLALFFVGGGLRFTLSDILHRTQGYFSRTRQSNSQAYNQDENYSLK